MGICAMITFCLQQLKICNFSVITPLSYIKPIETESIPSSKAIIIIAIHIIV